MNLIRNIQSIDQLRQIHQNAQAVGLRVVYLGDHTVRLVKDSALERGLAHLTGQQRRENYRLDSFVNQLRRHDLAQQGKSLPDRSSRIAQLVGKPVAAHIALRFVEEMGTASRQTQNTEARFDHAGRFLGVGQTGRALTELELADIEDNVLSANSKSERTAARVDREVLLDMMHALQKALHQGTPEQEVQIRSALNACKSQWLSHGREAVVLGDRLRDLAQQLEPLGLQELSTHAKKLAQEADQTKQVTQLHDNTFGRQFETHFVDALVEQPPAAALDAARTTGQYLTQSLQAMDEQERGTALAQIAKSLRNDHRPWTAEVPAIAQFIQNPSLDNYRALMSPQDMSGYQMMAITMVGVKTALEMPLDTPWLLQANDNYQQVVTQARSAVGTALGEGVSMVAQVSLELTDRLNKLLESQLQTVDRHGEEGARLQAQFKALAEPIQDPERTLRHVADLRQLLQNLERSAAEVPGLQAILDDIGQQYAQESDDKTLEKTEQRLGKAEQNQLAQLGVKFTPTQSTRHGIGLPHQPATAQHTDWQAGRFIPAGLSPANARQIKAFDQAVLQREQNAVVGPSGNTNIMTFLYQQIAKEQPGFSVSDGLLGTMTYLTFDGGHSLADTLATYSAIRANPADTRDPETNGEMPGREQAMQERRQALNAYVLDYANLSEIFDLDASRQVVHQAIEQAFDQTRQSFDQIHEERH